MPPFESGNPILYYNTNECMSKSRSVQYCIYFLILIEMIVYKGCSLLGNVVLNRSMSEIGIMEKYYSGQLSDKFPPGSVLAAKTAGCAITAYKSGKVLFQGNDCEAEASKWGEAVAMKPASSLKAEAPKGHLPYGFSELSVIGSDEVGTGDFLARLLLLQPM